MAIQYDKLNEAKGMLRTMREEFINGVITAAELAVQEAKVEADIREILGLPPIVPV